MNSKAETPLETLDTLDCELINSLQRGLPVCAEPYAAVASSLGLAESELLARLQRLLDIGILSRFGPMFQIERAGGRFTLAAIAVPPQRFDEVAAQVNAFSEVAHNYERTHELNMWFVVATESPAQCAETLARIEAATGYKVWDMPKQKEFRVQLYFDARPQVDSTVPDSGGADKQAAEEYNDVAK